MISSGTLSFWDPLAHKTFSNQFTPAFLPTSAGGCIAQTRWNTDQQNFVAQAHWSAQKKSVTGRNLGPGSRCHKKTLRAGPAATCRVAKWHEKHRKTCVYQPESKDTKGQSTCYASKFPSLLTRLAELLECDQLRLQPGTNDAVDATRSHTQIQRPYWLFFKFRCTSKYEVVVPCCTLQRKCEQRPTEPSILTWVIQSQLPHHMAALTSWWGRPLDPRWRIHQLMCRHLVPDWKLLHSLTV